MLVDKEVIGGSEDKLRFKVLVEDGNKVLKGQMDVGKLAPEPMGGTVSDNIMKYTSVYKNSITWLSSFATAPTDQPGKGPKAFMKPSWGKIANIGGEQVAPIGTEPTTVPAGQFDTVLIGWKSGGVTSHISVVDEFPFPVKASTWVQVTEGASPQEYRFVLHEYKENVSSNPFADITDTELAKKGSNCITNYEMVKIYENTNTNSMVVNILYGPEKPRIGCDIEWVLEFKKSFSTDLFENQVHYDVLQVDDNTAVISSAANDEGHDKLFSTSGKVHMYWTAQGEPGIQTFAVLVHGTGPLYSVPDPTKFGYILFDIELQGGGSTSVQAETTIPDWIKNNAGRWSSVLIDYSSFVSGIQWLISTGIVSVPTTEQGTGVGASVIPDWIKNNAGWWANGQIPDSAFVSGSQWLISNGVMTIS